MRQGIETTGDMNCDCCCCFTTLAWGVPVASLHRLGNRGGGGEDVSAVVNEMSDEVAKSS